MKPLLLADCIGKSYSGRKVLSSATLRVDAGSITVLLGRNGIGKSTLLKIAAGWIAADHGRVHLKEQCYLRPRLHQLANEGVFYLPDRALLSPGFSVRQHLEWTQRRYGHGDIEGVAQITGITDRLDQRPSSLSGGELRRAELAMAVLRRPDCFLADEPYREIAPSDMEVLSAVFRHMARTEGCGVVITGHDVPTLLAVADRVVWCTDGTTYDLGTPASACRDWRFRQGYLGPRAIEWDISLT
jgi:lipopolysaccharide export system ATP-binding protein